MDGQQVITLGGIFCSTLVLMFGMFQKMPTVVKVGTGLFATGAAATVIAQRYKN